MTPQPPAAPPAVPEAGTAAGAVLDLGFARVDLDRESRQGLPEVVYGPGKTAAEISGIVAALLSRNTGPVLVTRVDPATAEAVLHPDVRTTSTGGTAVHDTTRTADDANGSDTAIDPDPDPDDANGSGIVGTPINPDADGANGFDTPIDTDDAAAHSDSTAAAGSVGRYDAAARVLVWRPAVPGAFAVTIVTAGTSDGPVAAEAAAVAAAVGLRVDVVRDVGIAGLHRLLAEADRLRAADAVIVIAGMEGALASAVGGLVRGPVIAVPTSTGYGAALEGVTALLAMLTSCAAGLTVVNIDSGFAAAMAAHRLAQSAARHHPPGLPGERPASGARETP
jgi:NCAIR mutase (PurE)-related protein